MLPEKGPPGLLIIGIHWAFDVCQRFRGLQQTQPVAGHLRIGLFTGADQPDQLAVKALHKTVVQAGRDCAKRLLRQHRQYAAVEPGLRQQRQQRARQEKADDGP